jgi:branched-chain amino acid transport system ATP-binding protein
MDVEAHALSSEANTRFRFGKDDRDRQGLGSLSAESVFVRFGGLTAIDNISLRLGRREILGLIGPNGAGKTTMLNVLTGFLTPSQGHVICEPATDITHWQPARIARFGIARTFQNVRLFRDFTVIENLEASAIGVGVGLREARRRASEILDWFGLGAMAALRAETLPFGDERRIGIARALAMLPRFLLLDEPAAGLNDRECDTLMHTISQIPRTFGCGVLVIEHNMRVIMTVCERIQVINFGSTIAEGTPEEIQRHPEVITAYLGPAFNDRIARGN